MGRNFPHWIRAYCEHTAASEAETQLHFWTGVATIAGALRRRVWKNELAFQWTPNFYIIIVGPAGVVQKSTSINQGMKLLRKVEGVRFGPESMTWQGLGMALSDAQEYVKYGDADLTMPMSAITCAVSELGTFLRTDNPEMMSFLTRMWDGQEDVFLHRTKDSGNIEVPNPWLNVIGATTPTWLAANFPKQLIGEGLTSRIIFVYSEKKRHLIAYPSRHVRSATFASEEEMLVEDLQRIATLAGPYELEEDAYAWGEQWYKVHNTERALHVASDRYNGYLARKQGHLHKLAMVLAAAQRDELIIRRADLEEADKILTMTEQSMIKVFESIGVVDEVRHVAELLSIVKTYGWVAGTELRRLTYNIMAEKDFQLALNIAMNSGQLIITFQGGQRGVELKAPTASPASPQSSPSETASQHTH